MAPEVPFPVMFSFFTFIISIFFRILQVHIFIKITYMQVIENTSGYSLAVDI